MKNGAKPTTFKIGAEDAGAIKAEARRKGVRPGKVLKYWLRRGRQLEPQIETILT